MIGSERKKAIRFSVIFTVLVMSLAFLGPSLGGSPSAPGLGFILWGAAPLLVAVVLRLVTRDWSDAGLRPALRKNGLWYVLSVLAYPVMMVLTVVLGSALSIATLTDFSVATYLKTVVSALPIFFIFALFEEVGWRGYLVPKLASTGLNTYLASAIIGVVWATWHLPFIRELSWVYSAENLSTFIPRFYLSMVAASILYTEIRLVTGAVWPAVLIHCVMNAFGHPLAEHVTIAAGMDYLVSSTGLLMIAFTGLLGIALNHWRMRRAGPRIIPNPA